MSDTKKTHNLADTRFYTCLYELNQELKAEGAIFRLVHNFCFNRVEVVPVNATHLEYGEVVSSFQKSIGRIYLTILQNKAAHCNLLRRRIVFKLLRQITSN